MLNTEDLGQLLDLERLVIAVVYTNFTEFLFQFIGGVGCQEQEGRLLQRDLSIYISRIYIGSEALDHLNPVFLGHLKVKQHVFDWLNATCIRQIFLQSFSHDVNRKLQALLPVVAKFAATVCIQLCHLYFQNLNVDWLILTHDNQTL